MAQREGRHPIPWNLVFMVGIAMLRSAQRGFSCTFKAQCMREGVIVVVRLVVAEVAAPW